MKFTHHHSVENFVFDPEYKYPTYKYNKPNGFWLATDGSWREYTDNTFGDRHRWARYEAEFTVDLERCLVIADTEGFVAFDKKYVGQDGFISTSFPNWEQVAEEYAGIVIHPHQGWIGMATSSLAMWYYGWDCACACIWDLSVVKEVTSDHDGRPRSDRGALRSA